jgi:hypothetical protein
MDNNNFSGGLSMAKRERLNEEAARNNNTPRIWTTEDMKFLNQRVDRKTQLPKEDHSKE